MKAHHENSIYFQFSIDAHVEQPGTHQEDALTNDGTNNITNAINYN